MYLTVLPAIATLSWHRVPLFSRLFTLLLPLALRALLPPPPAILSCTGTVVRLQLQHKADP
jgi:hypothetical protein